MDVAAVSRSRLVNWTSDETGRPWYLLLQGRVVGFLGLLYLSWASSLPTRLVSVDSVGLLWSNRDPTSRQASIHDALPMRSPVIYLGIALSFLSCCCSLSKVSMRRAAAHPSSDCPLSTVFWFVLIAVVRLNAYTAGRRVTRLSPRLSPGRSLDHQFSVVLRLMSVCLSFYQPGVLHCPSLFLPLIFRLKSRRCWYVDDLTAGMCHSSPLGQSGRSIWRSLIHATLRAPCTNYIGL